MYVQRGTQRIEVIVRKESAGALVGANTKDPDQVSDSTEKSTSTARSSNMPSGSAKSRMLRVNLTHSFAVARQLVDASINYAIQGQGMNTGDQSLQDLTARNFEVYKDTTNVASSIAMGAVYGISGGPVGVIWGMALGALSATTSVAFKYAGRDREFNYKTFKENNSIEYQRARASISLTTGRLR